MTVLKEHANGRISVEAPAGRLSVRVLGSGPAVMLVHGIPGSSALWDGVAESLAARHRVLVPDLLGFGDSARPRQADLLWADSQAAALEAAIEVLAPAGVALVGHDFGGPVALSLTSRRPDLVTHLALAATNVFANTPIPLPISAVTWPMVGRLAERALFSRACLRLMVMRATGSPSPRIDPGAHLGDGAQLRSTRAIFTTALRELGERYAPVERALGEVAVPTLVAWGDRDPFFPITQAERTAAAVPGATLRIYEGCGHFVPAERPVELAADVRMLMAR